MSGRINERYVEPAGLEPPHLNDRERRILECLEIGLMYKEIEDQLRISHPVMRKLQGRIYRKLGALSRAEAVYRWHMGNQTAGDKRR